MLHGLVDGRSDGRWVKLADRVHCDWMLVTRNMLAGHKHKFVVMRVHPKAWDP